MVCGNSLPATHVGNWGSEPKILMNWIEVERNRGASDASQGFGLSSCTRCDDVFCAIQGMLKSHSSLI